MTWIKSWEVLLGVALILTTHWLPATPRPDSLADAGLWFGCIVLGAGLLRDLWALFITKPAHGPRETAMCVESIVGVATIGCALALLFLPLNLRFPGQPSHLVGFSLIFAGWVHDLVIVKRQGKFALLRHPDHGSFVVHLFRPKASACLLPPAVESGPPGQAI
jgi:hypothetical protein